MQLKVAKKEENTWEKEPNFKEALSPNMEGLKKT